MTTNGDQAEGPQPPARTMIELVRWRAAVTTQGVDASGNQVKMLSFQSDDTGAQVHIGGIGPQQAQTLADLLTRRDSGLQVPPSGIVLP